MTTEHIAVDRDDGWRSIVCTGTVVHIASVVNNRIRVRLGIASVSDGFVMDAGDTLSANETIYVKALPNNKGAVATICVIKD